MLDNFLLQNFVKDFYGYGNYSAPFWFIGMEEGGGGSLDEISQRLTAWDARGRRELEDVAGYHHAIGITRFWDEPVRLQSTWNRLIRIVISAKGHEPSSQEVKDYQRDYLGRENAETCLLELMPLPSPNASNWLYNEISSLSYLANRQSYVKEVAPLRIKHIRSKIAGFSPLLVLFYGLGYLDYWQEIAGISLEPQKIDRVYGSKVGNTLFVAAKHPAARGIGNKYFHEIGKWISAVMS